MYIGLQYISPCLNSCVVFQGQLWVIRCRAFTCHVCAAVWMFLLLKDNKSSPRSQLSMQTESDVWPPTPPILPASPAQHHPQHCIQNPYNQPKDPSWWFPQGVISCLHAQAGCRVSATSYSVTHVALLIFNEEFAFCVSSKLYSGNLFLHKLKWVSHFDWVFLCCCCAWFVDLNAEGMGVFVISRWFWVQGYCGLAYFSRRDCQRPLQKPSHHVFVMKGKALTVSMVHSPWPTA